LSKHLPLPERKCHVDRPRQGGAVSASRTRRWAPNCIVSWKAFRRHSRAGSNDLKTQITCLAKKSGMCHRRQVVAWLRKLAHGADQLCVYRVQDSAPRGASVRCCTCALTGSTLPLALTELNAAVARTHNTPAALRSPQTPPLPPRALPPESALLPHARTLTRLYLYLQQVQGQGDAARAHASASARMKMKTWIGFTFV
jgi:hypothetical protein